MSTRRADLITSIRQDEDNPAPMAVDAFARTLYGSHPYARKVRGSAATVESIRRQDLVRFYQKGFLPHTVTVVVVGDVEEEAAIAAIGKCFGDWTGDNAVDGAVAVPDADRARRAPTGDRADDEQGTGRHRLRLRRHPPRAIPTTTRTGS